LTPEVRSMICSSVLCSRSFFGGKAF